MSDLENVLNNNKLILLLCVVFANLNSNIMTKELERFEDTDRIKNHFLVRKIIIFAMTYVFTRDFKLALIMALIFFLINDLPTFSQVINKVRQNLV